MAMAERFIAEVATSWKLSPRPLSAAAKDALMRHKWPGNIRELRRAIERAMVVSGDGPLEPGDFDLDDGRGALPAIEPDTSPTKLDSEKARVLAALEACAGNQTHAARMLGLSRGTLISRLDLYKIPRPRK
jgi:DNA-binding NtrC family response regulator